MRFLTFYTGIFATTCLVIGTPTLTPREPACNTKACLDRAKTLSRLTAKHDISEACGDFDAFTCDAWRDENPIPAGQSEWRSRDQMRTDVRTEVLSYLSLSEPPIDSDEDRELFRIFKTAFNACMDVDAINEVGFRPVAEVMSHLAESFPVSDDSYRKPNSTKLQPSDSKGLGEVALYLARSWGLDVVMNIYTAYNSEISRGPYVPEIKPPNSITLWTDDYHNDTLVAEYLALMEGVLRQVHPNELARDEATTAKVAAQVLEFELRINDQLQLQSGEADDSFEYATIQEAGAMFPIYDIPSFIARATPEGYTDPTLKLTYPDILKALYSILADTSIETIQTYIFWRVIYNSVETGMIMATETKLLDKFTKNLAGSDPENIPDRSAVCFDRMGIETYLSWIPARWYLNGTSATETQTKFQDMVNEIKRAFIELIDNSWLGDDAAELAKTKVEKLDVIAGGPYDHNPVSLDDPQSILDYYKDLNVSNSDFHTWLSSFELYFDNDWRGTMDRNPLVFGMSPLFPGAGIVQQEFVMEFPAAIVQPPSFHPDYPAYLNFGGVGMILGHEISHSFDTYGAAIDPEGHLKPWWSAEEKEEFDRHAECYRDQYSAFTFESPVPGQEEMHVNGNTTVNENMADSNGLVGAFRAWQRHSAEHPEVNFDMPGLEHMSYEQIFFVQASSFFCSNYTPRGRVIKTQQDPHAMENFRILGSTDNSAGFKKAFECSDQEARCSTWTD